MGEFTPDVANTSLNTDNTLPSGLPAIPKSTSESKQDSLAQASLSKQTELANVSANKQVELINPALAQATEGLQQYPPEVLNRDRQVLHDVNYDLNAYLTHPESILSGEAGFDLWRQESAVQDARISEAQSNTAIDTVGDTALSVAKGGIQLINIIPTVAFLASGGTVGGDAMRGLQEATEGLEGLQSERLQLQREDLFRKVNKEYVKNNLNAYLNGDENSAATSAANFLKETGVALSEVASNPLIALDLVGEEAPSLLAGGLLGKAAGTAAKQGVKTAAAPAINKLTASAARVAEKSSRASTVAAKGAANVVEAGATATKSQIAVADALKRAAERTAKNTAKADAKTLTAKNAAEKAANKAGTKAATRAGILSEGIEEGAGLSSEAITEVLDTPEKELEKSDRYQTLLEKNKGNKDKAKQELAHEVGAIVFAEGVTITAALSKLTGAGKFEGNIFRETGETTQAVSKAKDKLKAAVNRVSKSGVGTVVKDTVREVAQEAGSGVTTQAIANQLIKSIANPTKEVRKGLAEEAALGGVAAGTLGGGASATKETVVGLNKAAEASAKGAAIAKEKIAKRFEEAGGVGAKPVDTAKADDIDDTPAAETAAEAASLSDDELSAELDKSIKAVDESGDKSPEEFAKAVDRSKAISEEIAKRRSAATVADPKAMKAKVNDPSTSTEELTSIAEDVIHNSHSDNPEVSPEDTAELLAILEGKDEVDPVVMDTLREEVKLNESVETFTAGRTTDQITQTIANPVPTEDTTDGTPAFKNMARHKRDFNQATTDSQRKDVINNVAKFAVKQGEKVTAFRALAAAITKSKGDIENAKVKRALDAVLALSPNYDITGSKNPAVAANRIATNVQSEIDLIDATRSYLESRVVNDKARKSVSSNSQNMARAKANFLSQGDYENSPVVKTFHNSLNKQMIKGSYNLDTVGKALDTLGVALAKNTARRPDQEVEILNALNIYLATVATELGVKPAKVTIESLRKAIADSGKTTATKAKEAAKALAKKEAAKKQPKAKPVKTEVEEESPAPDLTTEGAQEELDALMAEYNREVFEEPSEEISIATVGEGTVRQEEAMPVGLQTKLHEVKTKYDKEVAKNLEGGPDEDVKWYIPVTEALEYFKAESQEYDDFTNLLVDALLRSLKGSDIRVTSVSDGALGDSLGNFSSGDANNPGVVSIDIDRGLSSEVVLHEIVHAATVSLLETPANLRSKVQNEAITQLEDLRKEVEKYIGDKDNSGTLNEYAVTDLKEFVAVAMTNPDFQKVLKEIPYKRVTAYTQFVSLIRKALRIPASQHTAFEEVVGITELLINRNKKEARTEAEPEQEVSTNNDDTYILTDKALAAVFAVPGLVVTKDQAKDLQGDLGAIAGTEEPTDTSKLEAVEKTPKLEDNKIVSLFKAVFHPKKDNIDSRSILYRFPTLLTNEAVTPEVFKDIATYYYNVDTGKHITNAQADALTNIFVEAKAMRGFVESTWADIPEKDLPFILKRNPAYILRENETMEEVAISTVAIQATSWMISDAKGLANITKQRLNTGLLGRREGAFIPTEAYNYLRTKGLPRDLLYNQVGSDIFKALGFRIDGSAPAETQSNVAVALGTIAINALVAKGDLEKTLITAEEATAAGLEEGVIRSAVHGFTPVTDDEGEFPAETAELLESLSAARGVVDNVFKTDLTKYFPTFETVGENDIDKNVKNTLQHVSPQQHSAIVEHAKRPQGRKTDVSDLYFNLTPEQQDKVSGVVSDEELALMHVHERTTAENKNEGIRTERENLANFEKEIEANGGENAIFRFVHNTWQNIRIGMRSRGVNTQGSHTARILYAPKSQIESTIEVNGKDPKQITAFKLAAALMFDQKIDTLAPDINESYIDDLLEDGSKAADVLDILASKSTKDLTTEEQDAVIALASDLNADEPLYAIDGLINLARYKKALKTGKPTKIQADMFYEVDGNNNGPFIARTQIGLTGDAEKDRLTQMKGGISFDESKSLYELKADGDIESDYYSDYAQAYLEAMLGAAEPGAGRDAMFSILSKYIIKEGDSYTVADAKAIRALGKVGMIPANYAAGPARQAAIVADEMVNITSSRITEYANAMRNAKIKKEYSDAVDSLITTLQDAAELGIISKAPTARLTSAKAYINKNGINEDSLTKTDLVLLGNDKIVGLLDIAVGDPSQKWVKDVLKVGALAAADEQGITIARRDTMLTQARTLTALYLSAKATLVNSMKEANGGKDLTVDDMKNVEHNLKSVFPAFHNFYSRNNNNIDQATITASVVKDPNKASINVPINVNGKNVTTKAVGESLSYKHDSAVGYSSQIMGIDAVIMTEIMKRYNGLGLHDAYAVSVEDAANGEFGNTFNQITFEVLAGMDIFADSTARVNEALKGYASILQAAGVSADDMLGTLNRHIESEDQGLTDDLYKFFYGDETSTPIYDDLGGSSVTVPKATDFKAMSPAEQLQLFIKASIEASQANTAIINENGIKTAKGVNQYADAIDGGVYEVGTERIVDTEAVGESTPLPKPQNSKTNPLIELANSIESEPDEDIFFSNNSTRQADDSEYVTGEVINAMNVEKVFDGLADNDATPADSKHSKVMKKNLNGLVKNVMKPLQLMIREVEDKNSGSVNNKTSKVYLNIQKAGPQGERSGLLSRMRMSKQEVYLHELIHSVTSYALDNNIELRKEVAAVYEAVVSAGVSVDTFMPEGSQDLDKDSDEYKAIREEAEGAYNHIFNPVRTNQYKKRKNDITGNVDFVSTSSHLHEFVAFAGSNASMMKFLDSVAIDTSHKKSTGLAGKISDMISKIYDYAFKSITGVSRTHTGPASDRIYSLIKTMGQTNARNSRIGNSIPLKALRGVDSVVGKVSDTLESGAAAAGRVLAPGDNPGKVAGAIKTVVDADINQLIDRINKIRLSLTSQKHGFVQDIVDEVVGVTDGVTNIDLHLSETSHSLDTKRAEISDATTKFINNALKGMSKETSKAVTKALIKTDLSTFITSNDPEIAVKQFEELMDYITDNAKRDAEIARLTDELNEFDQIEGLGNFYNRMSRSLGSMLVKGEPTEDLVILNAHNIAYTNHEGSEFTASRKDGEAAKILIDRLASLHALTLVAPTDKNLLVDLINTDGGRKGLQSLLALHNNFKSESLKQNFRGQQAIMTKGFTKDLTNPHIDIKVATAESERELEAFGYVKGKQMPTDKAAGVRVPLFMYVNLHGGKQPLVTGAISRIDTIAAGTNTIDSAIQEDLKDPFKAGAADNISIHKAKSDIARDIYKSKEGSTNAKGGVMAGIYNRNGDVVDYRYMMAEATKDLKLEANYDVADVMGAMMGGIDAKVQTEVQNTKLVTILRKDYLENKDKPNYKNRYTLVGAKSTDPELVALWDSIPEQMQREVRKQWGEDGMYVRKDEILKNFGARTPSIIGLWTNASAREKSLMRRGLIVLFESVLGHKAPARLHKAEDILIEMVKMAKDNIVVKGLVVPAVNYLSNLNSLIISGVPLTDAVTGHIEAFRAAQHYTQINDKLSEAKLRLDTEVLTDNGRRLLQNRIVFLDTELKNSPIRDMIEAGMLQTIIEDVSQENDTFTFRKKWVEGLDKRTESLQNLIPKPLKDAGSEFFLLHGSKSYDLANKAVHLSDFAARYTLYKHMTTRKDNRLSPRKAYDYAMTLFINYEVPTNPYIQWANNTGVAWFTKYLLRNQKAIGMLARDNPGRLAAYMLFQQFVGPMADILDSSLSFDAIKYRMSFNPLNLLETVGEIGPVNAVTSLFS